MGGDILVHKKNVTDLDALREILTLENPALSVYERYVGYGKKPPKFLEFYSEEKDYIHIPRNTPDSFYKEHGHKMDPTLDRSISDFTFNGELRDYQKKLVDDISFDLVLNDKYFHDFVMQMPCGHGKTLTSIYYAAKILKQRTIVVVPSISPGVEQWEQALRFLLPDASVVTCAKKVNEDYRKADFFVINNDRLVAFQDKFPDDFWSHFGCTIFDEAHRDGAYTYLPLIGRFKARYRIALTATFRRKDNLHKILRYYFGTVYEVSNQFKKALILPVYTGLKFDKSQYVKETGHSTVSEYSDLKPLPANIIFKKVKTDPYTKGTVIFKKGEYRVLVDEKETSFDLDEYYTIAKYKEEVSFSQLDTVVSEDAFRGKMIISMLKRLHASGRKVLFLSKRKSALIKLQNYFYAHGYKSALVLGSANSELRKMEENICNKYGVKDMLEFACTQADFVFGITQLALDTFDAPNLDTLMVHTPIRDMEQPIGRIERFVPGKKRPLVLYLIDDIGPYKALFNASMQYAKGCKIVQAVNYQKVLSVDYLVSLAKD